MIARRRLDAGRRKRLARPRSASKTRTTSVAHHAKLVETLAEGVELGARRGLVERLRRRQGRRRARGDREGGRARRRGLRMDAPSAASPGAPSARSPVPPSAMRELGRRGPVVPGRSSPPAPTAPCRTPSRASARSRGELVRLRHGGEARRLLLRRHPHLRHRRARATRRARSTRSCARPRSARSTRSAPGATGRGVDAVARDAIIADRPRRRVRPRARARGRARGPRGAAPLQALRGRCSMQATW